MRLNRLEEEIFLRVFKSKRIPLNRREFKLLARKAVILSYSDGEVYLKKHAKVETVALVLSGLVYVYDTLDGDKSPSPPDFAQINESGPWEWVDSPQFIFNMDAALEPEPAAITIISKGATRLCVWAIDDIRTLCAKNPQISVCFLSVLSKDCACKVLKTKNYLLSTDLIREAARASYTENTRLRQIASTDCLKDSPKERIRKKSGFSPVPLTKDTTARAPENPAKRSKSRHGPVDDSAPPVLRSSKKGSKTEVYELQEMAPLEKIATSGLSVSDIDDEAVPVPESTTANIDAGSPVISEEGDDLESQRQKKK